MVHQAEAPSATLERSGLDCANCGATLTHLFAELGMQPPCQLFVRPSALASETFYPLNAYVCDRCFLVQAPSSLSPADIFTDYAYFSSYSDSWLAHARAYTEAASQRFGLNGDSFVIELASNDGYLLRNFVERGVPCLGIEPAQNVAEVARGSGVPTLSEFFGTALGERLASEGTLADLVVANNVFAQCPDILDFVGGIARVLKREGVLTVEVPHLMTLMEGREFDTIYHEHFFYFSLLTVEDILRRNGLRVFDLEELSTHGGSMRVFACLDGASHETTARLEAWRERERAFGIDRIETYQAFQDSVVEAKRAILEFLIEAKRAGKRIAAYGAPGKGNTLLNYCGIRTDFIDYAVDRAPSKQGMLTPGTHIPVYPPERLRETQPDLVVVMPWNLKAEIAEQHAYVQDWGGQFVILLPEVQVLQDGAWRPWREPPPFETTRREAPTSQGPSTVGPTDRGLDRRTA